MYDMDKTVLSNTIFVACPDSFPFAEKIYHSLAMYCPPAGIQEISYQQFASGEWTAQIPDTVRNTHVILFHAFHIDPTVSFMKMLISANALQLASATSIKLLAPFMPYQRQDRKDDARVPITARLLWNLIEANPKIKGAITLDMHSEQQQGFTNLPADNFPANRIHVPHLLKCYADELDGMIIVAPDSGGTKRAKRLMKQIAKHSQFELPIGFLDKRRPAPNVAAVEKYAGDDPSGKIVILYDDMIDTGGTIIAAANHMKGLGAREVIIVATHGIFSAKKNEGGNLITAEKKLAESGHRVIITNSIPRNEAYEETHRSWLTILPIEETVARVIYESFRRAGSVSGL